MKDNKGHSLIILMKGITLISLSVGSEMIDLTEECKD